MSGSQQDLHVTSTVFPHRVPARRSPACAAAAKAGRWRTPRQREVECGLFDMIAVCRVSFIALLVLLAVAAPRPSEAGTDVTLFRLFLNDGSALVSYGEYARLDDQVIFSMPAGGTSEHPRL